MLEPVQFILSPDQFDNIDYSQKQSLEVHPSVRDFANVLHPNNISYTKEVWEPMAWDLILPMGKQSLTTGTSFPFQGQNMVFLSVERDYREV